MSEKDIEELKDKLPKKTLKAEVPEVLWNLVDVEHTWSEYSGKEKSKFIRGLIEKGLKEKTRVSEKELENRYDQSFLTEELITKEELDKKRNKK